MSDLPDLDKVFYPPGECPGGEGIVHHPNCEHVQARVICDERFSNCRCHKDAGHLEAGDEIHECDPARCTGAWRNTPSDPRQVVRLPFPVGTPRPWPEEEDH